MFKSSGRARLVRCVLTLALVAPLAIALYENDVASQASGTSYSSPHFGYAVTWQAPWYVTEDDTDDSGFDVLGLADGQSMVYFSGGQSNQGSPAAVVAAYAEQIASGSDMANVQQLDSASCPVAVDAGTAVACYRADQSFGDGTQSGVGILLKAWDLGNGVDLLLEGYVEEGLLAEYLPKWQQFGIYAPGVAVPPTTAGCTLTVEHDVMFCFDPQLPERDRSDIAEAVRLGQDTIARYFGNPDLAGVRVNGFTSVSADGEESLASTLGRSIVVYTGSKVWQSITPLERIETLVHEYFHVYQDVLTEESTAAVPLWFTEGSAEAVGFQVVSQLGVADQTEIYNLNLYSLTEYPIDGPLSDLQTGDSMSADSYPLAYIAVQYLLGSKGMSVAALGAVYTQMQQGASFEDAFAAVFGTSLDQFYTDFAAWRPSLQRVDELPDDFWPVEHAVPASAIAMQSVPQEVQRGQQMVVLAKTAALADCAADLSLGGATLQRETFANGEGEIFWLITIPADVPAGSATLSLSCDSSPAVVQMMIT